VTVDDLPAIAAHIKGDGAKVERLCG